MKGTDGEKSRRLSLKTQVKLRAYAKLRLALVLISVALTFEPVDGQPTAPGHKASLTYKFPLSISPRYLQAPIYRPSEIGRKSSWVSWSPTRIRPQVCEFVARRATHHIKEVTRDLQISNVRFLSKVLVENKRLKNIGSIVRETRRGDSLLKRNMFERKTKIEI